MGAVTAATEEGEEEEEGMVAEDMMVDPAIPGAVVHRTGAGGIKSAAMVALIFFEVKKDKQAMVIRVLLIVSLCFEAHLRMVIFIFDRCVLDLRLLWVPFVCCLVHVGEICIWN